MVFDQPVHQHLYFFLHWLEVIFCFECALFMLTTEEASEDMVFLDELIWDFD